MAYSTMMISIKETLRSGDRVRLGAEQGEVVYGGLPCTLRAGDVIGLRDNPLLRILSVGWLPSEGGKAATRVYDVQALAALEPREPFEAFVSRVGFSLAWITMSDKGAAGLREDASGPLLGELVGTALEICHEQGFVIPDEENALRALLTDLALGQGYDLILTTGGTGVAPRDITPEATSVVIDKRLPGYERAMTAASLEKTPHGAISRAVAGVLGKSLVVNMPGSPKAVKECLTPLLPTLKHTLEKIQGDSSDCAGV